MRASIVPPSGLRPISSSASCVEIVCFPGPVADRCPRNYLNASLIRLSQDLSQFITGGACRLFEDGGGGVQS